jgi:hypothetical protein
MRALLPVAFAALLVVAGCSKDKDVEPPAKLVVFPTKLPVKELWGDKVGGGKKQVKLRLGLGPAYDDGLVFAASDKGARSGSRSSRKCSSPRAPERAREWWSSARARAG